MWGFLFLIVIVGVMCRVTEKGRYRIQWGLLPRHDNLVFADDIVLLSHTGAHVEEDRQLASNQINTPI